MTVVKLPQPGQMILGKYMIRRFLGRGAAGCVYEVIHEAIDRTFALKVMIPQITVDEDHKVRFLREARINAQLTHPNAVQVFDTGEWNGLLYILMEHLSGVPLRELLIQGQAVNKELWMLTATQIAQVLERAHSIGLVHRDLKPENIMAEMTGEEIRLVVVDFGLAFIQEVEGLDRMTQDRTVVSGTPAYLAPEQALSTDIGPKADIYALGCLLYEMASGDVPFVAPSLVEVLSRHLFVPPEPLTQRPGVLDLAPALSNMVMSMLDKSPEGRPSASDMLAILEGVLAAPDNQGRGRQGMADQVRGDRMVQHDTKRQVQPFAQPVLGTSAPRVACFGSVLSDDMQVLIATNGLQGYKVTQIGECSGADAIIALEAPPELVTQLVAIAPVIAGVQAGDMNRIQALMHAGAQHVLTWPIDPNDLVRKTKRAIKRSLRKKGSS